MSINEKTKTDLFTRILMIDNIYIYLKIGIFSVTQQVDLTFFWRKTPQLISYVTMTILHGKIKWTWLEQQY